MRTNLRWAGWGAAVTLLLGSLGLLAFALGRSTASDSGTAAPQSPRSCTNLVLQAYSDASNGARTLQLQNRVTGQVFVLPVVIANLPGGSIPVTGSCYPEGGFP